MTLYREDREPVRLTGFLSLNPYAIDVKTPQKRAAGCAAIKINRSVLISREFATQPFYEELRAISEELGFDVLTVPSLVQMRVTLGQGGSVPEARVWENMIRDVTKKLFRRGKPDMAELRQLNRLRGLVDTSRMRPEVADARLANAFRYNGEMTHVLLRWETKGKKRNYSFAKFFPNAEDAMADYLSRSDTTDLTLLEFA